ncbi:hypothetical protein ANABIO32_36630 [Rossellomorea marisflavi]|nr:hypothetical protein ANABIO32_36630 [Rossellomorea marisflavi]
MFRSAAGGRFPAGRGPEPLRLRLQGLNLPSFPAGVGLPPLLFPFGNMKYGF